jgi:hypothetical protein
MGILASTSPADSGGHFRFNIEFHGEYEDAYTKSASPYEIDCATAADGKPEYVARPVPETDM